MLCFHQLAKIINVSLWSTIFSLVKWFGFHLSTFPPPFHFSEEQGWFRDSYPISGTAMSIMIFMPQCTDCINAWVKRSGTWFKVIFEYPIYCLPTLKTNWFLAPFCSTCEPLGADCWECGGTLLLSLFNEALLFVVPGSESAWINYAEKPRGPLQHLPHFPKRERND